MSVADMLGVAGAVCEERGPAEGASITTVIVASNGSRPRPGIYQGIAEESSFHLLEFRVLPSQLLVEAQRCAPAVVLTDAETVSQLDSTGLFRSATADPAVRILVYGPPIDDHAVRDLIRLGCMGHICEGAEPAELRKAIWAIARGELWLARRSITLLLQQTLLASNLPRLTPREAEVLRMIAEGNKNRVIAEQLSISYDTVRWHIRCLHAKLGVQGRIDTAQYAQQYLKR